MRQPHIACYNPYGTAWVRARIEAEVKDYTGIEHLGITYNNIAMLKGKVPDCVPLERIADEHGCDPDPITHYFYKAELGDSTSHWVHPDSSVGDLAIVTYLPPLNGMGSRGGTALCRHIVSGAHSIKPHETDLEAVQLFRSSDESPQDWEITAFFGEVPGRTVCYPTHLFHCRFPRYGYGLGLSNCRIVHVAFLKQLSPEKPPKPEKPLGAGTGGFVGTGTGV